MADFVDCGVYTSGCISVTGISQGATYESTVSCGITGFVTSVKTKEMYYSDDKCIGSIWMENTLSYSLKKTNGTKGW